MAKLIITRRDVLLFEYLHACKVATTKQINRDIFKTSHATCYQRLKKYQEKDFLKVVPTDRRRDQSYAYEVTTKGEKIIKANLRDLISGDRFRSNSVAHDLTLVDIKNVLMSKNDVKEYFTENQIQTYKDFRTENDLIPFKEVQCDAGIMIQKGDVDPLYIGVEYESSAKSRGRYLDKIGSLYYNGPVYLIYICKDKSLIKKLKKIETIYIQNRAPKIFYITLSEFLESKDSVTFTRQDGKSIRLS
jgi:DNA-binding PadR family transcriptional regulator